MKPLSEKLAELSVEAKRAEDGFANAQSAAMEKLEQTRDEVRRQAQQALETVQQRVGEAREETRERFDAVHAKVNADFEKLRQQADESKKKVEAWQARNYADDKELDALTDIDYAIAAVKLAELQTLEAIDARLRADSMAEQIQPAQPIIA